MSDKRLKRLLTGIPGLDAILDGGVFRGGIYIIQGPPGAGKTILANQVCFAHAAAGGKALYVTLLSENHSRLLGHMQTLAFFDAGFVPDRVTYLSAFRILEEDGLKGLVDTLRREITRHKSTLLVLDGLVSAEETATSPRELKKFVHELQTQASLTDCTTYLLTSAYMGKQIVSAEHTMVDGIFELQSRLQGRRAEREIQIHKFRGSASLRGVHSVRIADTGIIIYPRIEALYALPSESGKVDGPRISLGVSEIDAMLGGGVTRPSNTLLLGPAGSGKSTLGLQFLGAKRAGRGLYFSLSESAAAVRAKAEALGLPVVERMNSGDVQTLWQPVTEALLDEVCARLLDAVRARQIERLFLDGADGLGKLTMEQDRISSVLTALSNELRALGVTTLSTAEMDLAGIVPGQPLAGLSVRDLSPIAENIIVLRHATTLSQTHRLIAVLKAREGKLDMRFRRYEIAAGGIRLDADHARAEAILSSMAAGGADPGLNQSPPLADPLGRGESVATVLVVDDEWAIAELLGDVLSDDGHRVIIAGNGKQALARIDGEVPDLIILDFMMPIMDGAAMLRVLGERPTTAAVPVLLMSSLPLAAIRDRCPGVAAYVQKPFLLDEISRKVHDLLTAGEHPAD